MFDKVWIGIKSSALIALCVGVFVIGAPMAKAVIGYFDAKEMLYNEQMIQLSNEGNLVSKRVEFNNELLQTQIKTLRQEIKDQAKARNQEIVAFGEVIAELKQDFSEQIGNVYKDDTDSSKDYVETVIKKQMSDGSEMPFSWAMYSPNIEGPEKWTTGTYPMKLHTKIALGEDKESGGRKDAYVESYMTSEIFAADKGKKFPIEIASVDWVEKPPQPYSFMFNPRLSLGFGFSNSNDGEGFGSIEASFFSYGQTKGDMTWRFLGLGLGIGSDNEFVYVAPVEYNIGKPLPIVENLFISPFIGLDSDSETIWGIQLQIPF
jgi:hypothetical protein